MRPGRHAIPLLLFLLAGSSASAQWRTIEPGGDTVCSDGSPYRFFVHPGDPAKLLLEFEGGGACWSDLTCAIDVYNRRVLSDPEEARNAGLLVGIYDRSHPDNPFRDWTHVYVPYCTGDLHWGNKTKTYTGLASPYTIQHKGAVNASAALKWTFDSVAAPAQVFVTGCSAGGYGSILWSPYVVAHYSGASAVHFSDSAAGIAPPGFFQVLIANWDVSSAWPSHIPSLALEKLDTSRAGLADLYTGIASYYPLSAFSQYNTLADSTQVFFYALAGGDVGKPDEWSVRMQASTEAIRGANPNFFSYTAPGSQHCIINSPAFYTTQVNGVRLVDWIRRLASTRTPGSVP